MRDLKRDRALALATHPRDRNSQGYLRGKTIPAAAPPVEMQDARYLRFRMVKLHIVSLLSLFLCFQPHESPPS